MILNFIQVWLIILIVITITSIISIIFTLTITGVIDQMDKNQRGEFKSFSLIVFTLWGIVSSFIVTQIIFLLS